MASTIQQTTTTELRTLVDFSRLLLIKAQEEADAYEVAAVAKAGITYTGSIQETRDWVQITGYSVPGTTTIEVRKNAAWIYRKSDAISTVYAKDLNNVLWEKVADYSWINVSTGEIRATADTLWPLLTAPKGECYVDGSQFRVLIPVIVWYDRTTGDTSLIGPGSSDFVGNSSSTIS